MELVDILPQDVNSKENSPSNLALNLLNWELGDLIGGRQLVAQLLASAAQQALAKLPGKKQFYIVRFKNALFCFSAFL